MGLRDGDRIDPEGSWEMEFITGLVVGLLSAAIGATGGVWLDRRFQRQDLEREICLEFLIFTDNIWPYLRETFHSGRDLVEAQNESERVLNEKIARAEVFVSDEIAKLFTEFANKWVDAVNEAIVAVRKQGKEIETVVTGQRVALGSDRDDFINGLRQAFRSRFSLRRLVTRR
jgi:hypothetical protein